MCVYKICVYLCVHVGCMPGVCMFVYVCIWCVCMTSVSMVCMCARCKMCVYMMCVSDMCVHGVCLYDVCRTDVFMICVWAWRVCMHDVLRAILLAHPLFFDYWCNVISCFKLMLSWIPTMKNWTLTLWAKIIPFSKLSLLSVFITVLSKVTRTLHDTLLLFLHLSSNSYLKGLKFQRNFIL